MLRSTQAEVSDHVIDLSLGHPGVPLLPLDILRRAAEHRCDGDDRTFLQYGYEQGFGPFRTALAEFLSRRYGVPVTPEELFVSNGVSQALDLICTVFTHPGDTVWVEEPTYFLALRIFADHRLKVIGFPVDRHGLVVDELADRLMRMDVAGGSPKFLYTVPAFQNPSGTTLTRERRKRLAELSLEHGFLIVADEVYHLLDYTTSPPPPLGKWALERTIGTRDAGCPGGAVYSLGSFSKILAPGLRLGWVQASPERLNPLISCGMLDSGGGLNPFTSAIVTSAIELGLQDEHLDRLRAVYKKRMQAMGAFLTDLLPQGCRFHVPGGGFYYWLELPNGEDAEKLLPVAFEQGVRFLPGTRFSSSGGLQTFLRLSYSYYEPDTLREGVRRLARSMESF